MDRAESSSVTNETSNMESDGRKSPLRSHRNVVWKIGRAVVFCILIVTLERLFFENYLHIPEHDLSVIAPAYQAIVTLGYRAPAPRFSGIVHLDSWDPRAEPCTQRAKMNVVLGRILNYQPRAIVVASTLRENLSCPAGQTEALLKTIRTACLTTPIIFGLGFPVNFPTTTQLEGVRLKTQDKDDLCGNGHTSPEKDFRLLPFRKHVGAERYSSLSWVAASTVDETLVHTPALARALRAHTPRFEFLFGGEELYTSLFVAEDFRDYTVSEAELLDSPLASRTARKLKGRVVVVGLAGQPEVDTSLGRISADVLQATYIEAFLDGRVLMRLPDLWHWLLSFAFWFYVDWPKRRVTGFIRILTGLGLLALLDVMLVQFGGYYNDFSTISIAGLFTWSLRWVSIALHGSND